MSLVTFHGEIRWLVALLAIVIIVKFSLGLVQKAEYQKTDRILMSAFVGFMDFNLLLGIILLFQLGLNSMQRIEHATTMILAIVVGHSNAAWKRKSSQVRFRNNLIVTVVAMLLVFVGVWRLRGGFMF